LPASPETQVFEAKFQRADEHLGSRDTEGSAVGQRILAAIEKLRAEKPEPGETVQQRDS
jgi:hypothetical protein